MKKLLLFFVLGLNIVTGSNAMELRADEASKDCLTEVCSYELQEMIVCCLDYPSFIAFTQVCSASNNVCENIVGAFRLYIIFKAADDGKIKLACRFIGIPSEGMTLKSCGRLLSLQHVAHNGEKIVSFITPKVISAQACMDVLVFAVEFASLHFIKSLFQNNAFALLINQNCADAILNKCIEIERDELSSLLDEFDLFDKASSDVIIHFFEKFYTGSLIDTAPEDTLFFDGDSDISFDAQ